MTSPREDPLLYACTEIQERLRQDQARVPVRLRGLLAYLAEHLLEPGLSFTAAKRACQIRANNAAIDFARHIGLQPRRYIIDCRMHIAARLLVATDWPLARISEQVGYTGAKTFAPEFKKWARQSPSQYRRRQRHARPAAPPADPRDHPSLALLHRAIEGSLDAHEARTIDRLLGQRQRRIRQCFPPLVSVPNAAEALEPRIVDLTLTSQEEETLKASQVTTTLESLPVRMQSQVVKATRFRTPALFERLLQESHDVRRRDPRRAASLARLAIDSLAGIGATDLGSSQHALLVTRGWTFFGNLLRLDLDFLGAEAALRRARDTLPERHPVAVEAEILKCLAALRWYQRRLPEALELSRRSVDLFRATEMATDLAEALVLRALLLQRLAAPRHGLDDLQEALRLLHGSRRLYLCETVHHNLALCHHQTGDHEAAIAHLSVAHCLADALGARLLQAQLQAIEGRIAMDLDDLEQAAKALELARSQALVMGRIEHAAIWGLDLARAEARQQHHDAAQRLVAEVLPVLETLHNRQEATVAIGLLRRALAREALSSRVLDRAQQAIDSLLQDPALRFGS